MHMVRVCCGSLWLGTSRLFLYQSGLLHWHWRIIRWSQAGSHVLSKASEATLSNMVKEMKRIHKNNCEQKMRKAQ